MNNKFYLYRWIMVDKNIPFYIGVGTKSNNYEYSRAANTGCRSIFFKNIINKTDCYWEILIESDNRDFIFEKEKEFINSFYGVSKNNIEVLPNSVEVPNESVILNKINNRCLQDLPISILFIGRIDSNKGLKEILDAFKSVKAKSNSFKFYLAGTGPDETSFIAECNNILGDGFKYMGILDYKSKQKLFLQIDVFILPSYFEGLPNGLLETMSYGIVPIVTPVGSIPEVVTDSQTGYFVSVKDSLSLTCVIERIISNKGMLKELGVNCYKKINEKYSISNYIIKLNSIYFEML